jgi:glycosyltransferase involved in cell wall biosynthesis
VRVQLVGQTGEAEISELMAGAAILVAPWLWNEPFGRVIPEALSRGTPIVMTDHPGPRSVVGDGPHCAVYRAGHPQSLVAAVEHLLVDSAANRAAARRRYESAFTPAANLSTLKLAYSMAGVT